MSGEPTSAGFLPTDPPLVVDKSHAGSGFGVAHESPVRGSWSARSAHTFGGNACNLDQGYGREGTPIFTGVFEPVARVSMYPTDGNCLGTCFGEA